MNYTQPKIEAIAKEEGKEVLEEALRLFDIPDTEFSDGTVGTLGIQIASSKEQRTDMRKKGVTPRDMFTVPEIEAREEAMRDEGMNYKLIAITSDYLDDYEYDFNVISKSLEVQEMSTQHALTMERQEIMATLYPEYFAANKEKEFKKFLEGYGESIEEYNPPPSPTPTPTPARRLGKASVLGLEE